jgi:hypothetical protein
MKTNRTSKLLRLAVAGLVSVGLVASALPVSPVEAATSRITKRWFEIGKTANPLSGFSVSGYEGKTVLANISLGTSDIGTLGVTVTTGLTLSYGYTKFTGSSISFTGSQDNVNGALATLYYDSPSATTLGTRITVRTVITEAKANIAYFPANQHFYEYVKFGSLTGSTNAERFGARSWAKADEAAKASKQFGLTGYLANITSAAENDFVAAKVEGARNIWIGGSDKETENTWKFTDGPEKGQNFWNGCSTTATTNAGSAPAGGFGQWAPGEPNNWISNTNKCGGTAYDASVAEGEDCAVTNWSESGAGYESGYWNDVPCDVSTSEYTAVRLQGYLIEYGTATDSSTYGSGVDISTHTLYGIKLPQIPPTPKKTVMTSISEVATKLWKKFTLKKPKPNPWDSAVKVKRGSRIVKSRECGGPWAEVTLTMNIPTTVKPNVDILVFSFVDAERSIVRFEPCSVIAGRSYPVSLRASSIRATKSGEKVTIKALIRPQGGKTVNLRVHVLERLPDGMSRSYLGATSQIKVP